jgi:ATP-binding cassette subfamily C (CFTR/MRP) protein 1
LNAEGKVVQDGTYTELEADEGYVKSLVSKKRSFNGDEQITEEKPISDVMLKVKNGVKPDDEMDLTRRTGDMAVYKYYYKSIGPWISFLFVIITLVYCFVSNFPRK